MRGHVANAAPSLALNVPVLLYFQGYMKRPDDEPDDETKQPPKQDAVTSLKQLHVMQALLATTWRIAVPVIIGSGLGIFLDLRLGTKPWLTLLGVLLGFTLAGLLIARLLKETENN